MIACGVLIVSGFQFLSIIQAETSSVIAFIESASINSRPSVKNKIDHNHNSSFSKNDSGPLAQSNVMASSTMPPFKSLRYDEDYRYLKDSKHQHDFWDPIKFIPLNNRKDWFLSFDGEIRQKYEYYHNPNFGRGSADSRGNNDYLLQRYLLHGDLHLGQYFRFFGHSPATTITWQLNRNITILASYIHFFPGLFFNNNHRNNSVDYFTSWITYNF